METVDAVVVGSGFGGAVAAARLAEQGRGVVVLERGKRYPPGSFPRSPAAMATNFWDPSQGMHGLFDIWSFSGIDAVVSAGLGGGSLIYANVLIRKDEHWFVEEDPRQAGAGYEYWPVDRATLDPYYDVAESMLGATPYPFDVAPYSETPKTRAMQEAAGRLIDRGRDDLSWHLPKLAVNFGGDDPSPSAPIPGEHLHGPRAHRRTCRLCGECDIGCNDGAKNTLDYNYLTLADQCGADLRDRHEVQSFERAADGSYVVRYRDLTDFEGTSGEHAPQGELRCRVLVLAAGAFGSTYLMLRNRASLGPVSPALGHKFCGNGDLLGFFRSEHGRRFEPSTGPVITSAMRVGDALDGDPSTGRGFYLEDGGYPDFANWLVETVGLVPVVKRGVRAVAPLVWARATGQLTTHLSRSVARAVGDGRTSAGTLPVLGMGRDIPDGIMTLDGKWLDVDWDIESSTAYFGRLARLMCDVSGELDATASMNPTLMLKRVVTVHPLGGCPMGTTSEQGDGELGAPGVVDDHGEVFGNRGLFVADGSVLPGPVGPNPSLTIAALAERFSARMIERSA